MKQVGKLILEDGREFVGQSYGAHDTKVGEIVFNTNMYGYQETFTDPSYAGQLISLTYPEIGNVGVNPQDQESDKIWASGIIVGNLNDFASNWRSEAKLTDFCKQHHTILLSGIDTRALTQIIREQGAKRACISSENISKDVALKHIESFSGLNGLNLAKEVSTAKAYTWLEGQWDPKSGFTQFSEQNLPFTIVAFDYGIKRSILRYLVSFCHAKVIVVPHDTSAEAVLDYKPDGIFLSNGPGDPEPMDYAIATIKQLITTGIPIFGICLGHQLLALASGASTFKMKVGHHGGNHPVQSLADNRVVITSQNHGFAVKDSLPSCLEKTHVSLFDGTIQGIRRTDYPAFSFQGHPEASPGPHDVLGLFSTFKDWVQKN